MCAEGSYGLGVSPSIPGVCDVIGRLYVLWGCQNHTRLVIIIAQFAQCVLIYSTPVLLGAHLPTDTDETVLSALWPVGVKFEAEAIGTTGALV